MLKDDKTKDPNQWSKSIIELLDGTFGRQSIKVTDFFPKGWAVYKIL